MKRYEELLDFEALAIADYRSPRNATQRMQL